MREIIATGKTVEEATENGCQELGLTRDQVSVEILEMPTKKLFKNIPAKVKLTAEDAPGTKPEPAKQQKERAKPAPAKKTTEKAPAPQQAGKEPVQAAALPFTGELEEEIEISTNEPVRKAAEYLTTIFNAIGVQALEIQAFKQGDATLLQVESEEIGGLLETRGETIQALSYLVDRAVNKGVDKKEDAYLRVRLDVAGYRNRREGELVALANRTAEEVNRTKRSRTLAPMNPYERLIIHTTISNIDGVMSESIGADTERRVVVKSTAPDAINGDDWRPYNKNSRGGRSGGHSQGGNNRRGGGGDRGRGPRPSGGGRTGNYGQRSNSTPEREYAGASQDSGKEPVIPQRREAIRDGEDMPLYGKIEP